MYVACNFHTILTQAVEQLGYCWYHASSRSTSHGLQGRVHFALGDSLFAVPRVCLIVGRPCAHPCQAKKSALIHALIYLNDVLRYIIGDVHYTDYVMALGD
jgi:hypothetical protein